MLNRQIERVQTVREIKFLKYHIDAGGEKSKRMKIHQK